MEYRLGGYGVWVDWEGARMGREYWTLVGRGDWRQGWWYWRQGYQILPELVYW